MLIDCTLTPAEIALLPQQDLTTTTCVVFDVLRATSSMLTALAGGAAEVIPVSTIEEARARRADFPKALLGGERHGERIEGFDLGNSPFEYQQLLSRTVISTTTNGTVALRACAGAKTVLIGAILNLAALAEEIHRRAPEHLLLVCAGTFTTFALEDAWAAGRLVQLLAEGEHTDAAECLGALAEQSPAPLPVLQRARNGRTLESKGRGPEVAYCAQESVLAVNGEMVGGIIRPVASARKPLVTNVVPA